MSRRSPYLLIDDMLEAIGKLERFTAGYDYEKFIKEDKTTDAVVRNLEIIGEAASRIPAEIRGEFHKIEWSKMIGLRHRIVHEYFGVDLEIVWRIVRHDIPSVKLLVEEMRDKLKK